MNREVMVFTLSSVGVVFVTGIESAMKSPMNYSGHQVGIHFRRFLGCVRLCEVVKDEFSLEYESN